MTIYAVAREVPEGCNHLTAGKRYEVSHDDGIAFSFIDDDGDGRGAYWVISAHLNGKDWHRIETDAEGWAEWKPSKKGEAPPDWQDGWECQFLSSYFDLWSTLFRETPIWCTDNTYRYRPRTIAEPANEPAQVECDHPNADDYRNRAERAEAEAAELRERVRKLEALICDGLLAGGDE